MLIHYLIIIIISLFLVGVAIHGVEGGIMVSGTVFCDQCKDGQVSIFDYPLSGMRVAMVCPSGSDGQMIMVEESRTNMLGNYWMSFPGTPDISRCYTQIILGNNNSTSTSSNGTSGCEAVTGPPKSARLMFSMFDMVMYTVDPLISQPAQPMSYCSTSSSPTTTSRSPPPPPPSSPSMPPREFAPFFRLPPMPGGWPSFPPLPLLQKTKTACSYQKWMMGKYRCKWGAMKAEMKVGLVFGALAGSKYGKDMTLYRGLQGRGGPYKTLLREAITSLLNSYHFHFTYKYNAFQVLAHFNAALAATSNRTVLAIALGFKRANNAQAPCNLTSCRTPT